MKSFKGRKRFRPFSTFVLFGLTLSTIPLFASSVAPGNDPAQWTSEEVYQILNKSPWTQTVKVNLSKGDTNAFGSQMPPGSGGESTRQMPMAGAGVGRRGMGGRSSATYSSGRGGAPDSATKSGPTEIKIQWQSATVVQIAAAKSAGDTGDASKIKPLDDYVVAVIGLPITAVGGNAASADSASTVGSDQENRIKENVKKAATIVRSGHEPLAAVKVELDQGRDGRTLIYFPKSDPITASEKSIEFRLAIGHAKLKKKFETKDLEFRGKLDL